jgi:outer membrane protein assembly factor BamB
VESAQSYTTPIVAEDAEGKETIYVLGADHITAHDAATGSELWRVGGLNPSRDENFRSIASPVLSGEVLIAPYARGRSITAVRLGGRGDVTGSHIAWFIERLGADVPTPAAYEGRVYVGTDRGEVACLDGATGKVVWRGQLERSGTAYSSSPVVAGGHVYFTREDGTTVVLKAGDAFQVVGTNRMDGEYIVATPVFIDNIVLVRTYQHLYCIGK